MDVKLDFSKDVLFDNIVENIKNKTNNWYECDIIEEKNDYEIHMKFIILNIDGIKSQSFILDENNENLVGKIIKFDVNSLKSKVINGKIYFIIKKYELLEEKKDIKRSQLLFDLPTDSYKIVVSTKEMKSNYLYTLILKAKEIKEKTQKYKFQLEDSKKNIAKIQQIENLELESRKIYCLHGYIYNNSTSIIERTNISYIEELESLMLKINNSKDIFESKSNSLLNFKGQVKSFNISDKIINIKDENNKNYKINANYDLIKQISLNSECKFFNFIKKNNEEFIFSNLSFIEAKEETFIDFNFLFYGKENQYYNKIKINDKYYDINNENIKIKIEDRKKSNLFLQKVIYERVIEEKSLDSYEINLILNKGKIYHLISSSEKGGFSYEFYIQAINEINLPKNLTINFKKEKLVLSNPDKNGNKLKERFTVVNFPKQDVETILGLNLEDNKNIIEDDNFIYLFMIDSNNNKTLKQLIKTESPIQKKDFYISEETEFALEKASSQCYINFNENYENQLYNIDENNIKEFSDLMYELYNGFQNFEFENNKRNYKIIKDIVSFSLNYFANLLLGKYYSFRKNYEILLDSMITLEYIDRIKILISFLVKFLDSMDNKKVYYDMFHLIDLDNSNSYEKYPYIKDAFDIFYKIIDNLTEESQLFQAIHQFNSIIYKDVLSGESIHSGSILNLNDIKLELIKNINRFIFLSEKSFNDCEEYANFEKTGLLVTFNIFSFSEDENKVLDETNYKRITSIILFLLLHECLGHQKKHINNEKSKTPRQHYKCDFQDFLNKELDTGLALEIILLGKIANIRYLMKSSNSEKLLEPNLYTGKDFIKLQEIYALIEKDNIDNINLKEDNIHKEELNRQLNKNKTQSPNKIKIRKKNDHLMYPQLFQLYSGISDEQKEKLKDDEDYQRYLKICKRRHQKQFGLLKKEDLFAFKLLKKK